MTDPIRWGILGTGGIASSFAAALRHVTDAELVAVGSRAQDSADRFAAEHDVPRGYGSYDDLVGDDDVDVVYVATPHTRHAADMALALEAGKHVLGEKPFTINQEESARIAELAAARGRFAMEAFWSRFLPAYRTLRTLLDDEAIGEVLRVEGSFGFRADVQADAPAVRSRTRWRRAPRPRVLPGAAGALRAGRADDGVGGGARSARRASTRTPSWR